jgi:hypothetical protein
MYLDAAWNLLVSARPVKDTWKSALLAAAEFLSNIGARKKYQIKQYVMIFFQDRMEFCAEIRRGVETGIAVYALIPCF